MEQMVWYAVVLVSLIAGYLIGFNRGQSAVSSQFERILKQQQEQAQNGTAVLRGMIAELEAQIKVLTTVEETAKQFTDGLKELKPE